MSNLIRAIFGKESNKPFFYLIIMILSIILSLYLFLLNLSLKKAIFGMEKKKEQEFNQRILKEREFIKKDLDEEYRADVVSYEAMARRLEIEKNKVRELEGKMQK